MFVAVARKMKSMKRATSPYLGTPSTGLKLLVMTRPTWASNPSSRASSYCMLAGPRPLTVPKSHSIPQRENSLMVDVQDEMISGNEVTTKRAYSGLSQMWCPSVGVASI